MHWHCLAWEQSTSSGHPFLHPKPRNFPHQIDPFPTCNNPSNACLCVLPPALLSANRVSPLNETLFQSTHCQMKWRQAHCTRQACDVSSLSDLLRADRIDEIMFFSADGYGSYWQIIHNIRQILMTNKIAGKLMNIKKIILLIGTAN